MKKTFFLLILLIACVTRIQADDWVLFESKYNATHYTDHLYLEVFLADLDGKNTYCQTGTLIATNGSKSIDLLTLKYINEGDDESQTAQVKAKLLMKNAKAWFTNSQSGDLELSTSEKSYWLTKWGGDYHYMTAKINLYYSAEMAGGDWKIYFNFKHSNDNWYNKVLRYSVTTSSTLGLPDYNVDGYKIERTGLDKITFTAPQLPNDIDSKFSSIRKREAKYEVQYIFFKQDGKSVTMTKAYEASTTQRTVEECSFPEGVGNPTRIDYRLSAVHGVKDPDNWFNKQYKMVSYLDACPVIPVPGAITTDYHQFDRQAVLAWSTPSGSNYLKVTPYIYCVETDENGTPKSGSSWSKRGSVSSTTGGSLSFTDDNVNTGTYYRYMAVNVPTDWINHGINESSLSNPTDDLLAQLGCSYSAVLNTAPTMSIYNLRQDTSTTDKVRLTWQYSRVPTDAATVNFKILRKKTQDGDWSEYGTVSGDANPAAGASLAFEDSDLPNSTARYQYKVRLEEKGYRFESDALFGGLLSGTTLKSFTATKGTHDGSVTLSWNARQVGTANSNYVISRRYVNSTGDFMQIYTTNGADANYSYEDNTVKPGYYYEYKVEIYEGTVLQNTLYTIGFCQAKGTISGIVKYGSGTAVPDVKLWLRPSATDEDNTVKTSSQYVQGASKGIAWEADATETGKIFGSGKAFTVQFFVRPDEELENGSIMAHIPGTGTLYLGDANAEGYDLCINTSSIRSTGLRLPAGKFSLLTLSKSGDQVRVQLDKGEIRTKLVASSDILAPFSLGGVLGISADEAFKGNFVEVRVWDHVLSDAERNSYADRMLHGRESGLVLYWPLDEGLERYAFDASYANDLPNGRHATVGNNIAPSSIVPGDEQLSRYSATNENGEYLLRGVPFMGSGSSYSLVPEKGIHRFNPDVRSLFISPTSLTANNVDFEDVSSFPMTGHIYYAGTNIPAEGVQFYVDGTALTSDGKVQQTDADGYYSISVPIGEHYVEAKLEGHTFADGGRFPITGTYNFADRVRHDFSDSTLVNFVGRVSGAKYNDTLPVGFAESHNNIGIATITLKLNNESFSFNCADDYISPATENRSFASDTASIQSKTWTGFGAASKYIYINTDSLTGEFSALLPPLKYTIQSIEVKKNSDVEFTSLPEIDLTNPSLHRTDSIRRATESGDTVSLSYEYNLKQIWTHIARPQVDVVETNHPVGAFGRDTLLIAIDETRTDTLRNLYTMDASGNAQYMFNYPIYQMMNEVEYALHGYEAYTNYDTGTPVTDTVPMNGQELIIGNEMSADQAVVYDAPDTSQYKVGEIYDMKYNTITLDKEGRARLMWTVGAPNIVSPFTRQFSLTLKRDERTYDAFRMDAIVLGQLTNGNNFVTSGPDDVLFILRDPYGAHSKTTLKKGTINTQTEYYTYQRSGEHSAVLDIIAGTGIATAQGVGFAVISKAEVAADISIGMKASWKYTHKYDKIYKQTTVESYSTGDQYPYVGAMGDVFIGTSNNILIGTCRKVFAKKDVLTNKYNIVLEDALALGTEVKTSFAYSQYELEKVMIPKWKDQRKQYLTQVATKAEADNYVNNSPHVKCVTWLSPSDPNYGEPDTYRFVEPEVQPEKSEEDSVLWCNNQITKWEEVLRKNEEAKIKAMQEKTPTNYAIDGGTSRTFTYSNDTVKMDQKQTDYNIQAVLGWQQGWKIKNVVRVGLQTTISTNVGGGEITGSGDDKENYTEWEYVLNDGNRDADLSINVYDSESGNNSKIFSLFGGQTYNPYEPADSTHYYQPDGKPLPLGNGSIQMEQPYIQIGVGNSAPGKSATLTDIPAGQSATATLYCSNMTNTHQAIPFGYDVRVMENTDTTGLQILMDGVPINGRTIWMEQGTTSQKVITVQQTDQSILDHEGIRIRFLSQYQPAVIYDEVVLNAHFMPSSSPVALTVANPVVNTDPTTGNGQLSLKVSGFNRQFKNLKQVGIQYRFAGNTNWTNLYTWVTNAADTVDTKYELLPATGDLKLTLDMSSNLSYPEGDYEFRAFTMTPYGTEQVQIYSEVTKVVKDMTLPRPLYTPAPANGILGIGDQLAVEFNEDIVPGYVGDKNAIITAKLNGRPIDHEVSLRLIPYGDEVRTANPVFLSGNFSMEFWFNWHEAGTILHQGAGSGNFSISINAEGYVIVSVAGIEFTSKVTIPADKWMFVAMNYKAETLTFNMLAQYDETTAMLFQNTEVPESEVKIMDYVEDNYLYLGRIYANIHDLALYSTYRDVLEAAGKKYESKDAYTYGLTNYWSMNEGHGKLAEDSRHTHDFIVPDSWDISNTNYALRVDTASGAQVDISRINTTLNDSYVIELWYDHYVMGSDTIFETNGLCLRFDGPRKIVLDYGNKSHTVVTYEDFPEMLNSWHHYALNVVRGQAASFYFDGHRSAVIAEADMPVLKGATMTVAKGTQLAYVDELRIWKATLSEERLLSNRFNTLDTSDVYSRGLIAYYPFEKDSVINGVDTKGFTLENFAPKSEAGDVTSLKYNWSLSTPPIKNAPREVRLTAAPVASERKVVINLLNTEVTPRELEGTTLNITLAEIHDLHGNTSNPIKWTAYVQQNTLKWKKDSVTILKKYGDSYTFDVDIENKGGQIEYYTVANMPEWLTLVDGEQSDDLKPLKTKTLRFAVNPLVPVNDYDVTIGLQGNNEILEPLRIVMKVRGETPDWFVDPTLYDHNMTIIGQVYIGGILMENSESLVAAFIGGECRGVAAPTKVRGAAYVSLPIYGHDVAERDANKPVSFRIWDATRGVAYTDARIALEGVDTLIIFHQDSLIGNYDAPAIWTKSDKVEQLLTVHENWNWIALGVAPETTYCDRLFADYGGWGILLKDRNTYIQSNGSEWKGNLVPAENTMYKMKITRTPATEYASLQTQFSVRGQQHLLKDMPVVLEPGWNWIAYTPLTTKRINAALAGSRPKAGDIIKSQTAVSIYGTNGWEGTLQSLESGHGYLYFSTGDETKSFTYPDDMYMHVYPAPSRYLMALSRMTTLRWFTPVDQHNYPSNMTMTIRLLDGDVRVDSCEIAAFVGDECRGAIRADDEGLYYLVISGEGAGQTMTIRTVIDDEEVTIEKDLTYVSDDHVGTPWDPYIIQLNPGEGIENVNADADTRPCKIIEDNHIVIIRHGEKYDVTGKKL